jgi:hypothetical protein
LGGTITLNFLRLLFFKKADILGVTHFLQKSLPKNIKKFKNENSAATLSSILAKIKVVITKNTLNQARYFAFTGIIKNKSSLKFGYKYANARNMDKLKYTVEAEPAIKAAIIADSTPIK